MTGYERPIVLIVDDLPRNLDVLEAMLAPVACTLVRAQSAEEALLCLLRHEVAALVLDVRMPGMGGIELARLIKQRKRSQHIPILFLTAHFGDEADVLRGYGAGAVDYLTKPIIPEVLRSKVGVFVDLYRKTRALAEANDALQREIVDRELAQQALRAANEDLERRVQERTIDLQRAHREVQENEARLRMALDVAQIAAWEWRLESNEVAWSTDPEELFGFPAGSFGPGRRLLTVLHPEDRARLTQAIEAALRSGDYQGEYRALRPDGRTVWITERGRVEFDERGAPERIVGISRDVTADREAEQERERLLASAREARDEAQHQMRLKDEFLATLSHELRTPMNAILGWLSILQSGKPVAEPAAALAVIQRNAQAQARLIDDLLDMTRLMLGHLSIESGDVDLNALLHTVLQGQQPAAAAKGVELIGAAGAPLPAVRGDARRLQQVLWNLVNNGIKFTPAGGTIRVHGRSRDACVEIQVSDNGRGISPAFLPYVFERFRQEEASTTRETYGLGLGLSIAKHLVELHGGRIEASSPGEGLGATFLVTLPVAAETVGHNPAAASLSPSARQAASGL